MNNIHTTHLHQHEQQQHRSSHDSADNINNLSNASLMNAFDAVQHYELPIHQDTDTNFSTTLPSQSHQQQQPHDNSHDKCITNHTDVVEAAETNESTQVVNTSAHHQRHDTDSMKYSQHDEHEADEHDDRENNVNNTYSLLSLSTSDIDDDNDTEYEHSFHMMLPSSITQPSHIMSTHSYGAQHHHNNTVPSATYSPASTTDRSSTYSNSSQYTQVTNSSQRSTLSRAVSMSTSASSVTSLDIPRIRINTHKFTIQEDDSSDNEADASEDEIENIMAKYIRRKTNKLSTTNKAASKSKTLQASKIAR
jgi:hypothetical protein